MGVQACEPHFLPWYLASNSAFTICVTDVHWPIMAFKPPFGTLALGLQSIVGAIIRCAWSNAGFASVVRTVP